LKNADDSKCLLVCGDIFTGYYNDEKRILPIYKYYQFVFVKIIKKVSTGVQIEVIDPNTKPKIIACRFDQQDSYIKSITKLTFPCQENNNKEIEKIAEELNILNFFVE